MEISSGTGAAPVLRPAFAWIAALTGLPVVVLSAFRAVPGHWPDLVVQMLAFTPWLGIPAVIALSAAFLSQHRWLQVVTGAVLVGQLFWLFPLDGGRPAWADDAGGAATELKVMTLNSALGQADAGRVMELAEDNRIGLLTLQEHTAGLQDRLSEQGMDVLLPYRISDPRDDGTGSAIYSRYPLEQVGLIPDTPFLMPTVRVTARSGGSTAFLEVTNVHVTPPIGEGVAQWRSDLAAVGTIARQGGHRLLIGDFNATLDHAEFRSVLNSGQSQGGASGMADVAALAGSRLVPTWPMEGLPLPGITLDHMLVSPGVGSAGFSVLEVAGTDHAALLATLSIRTPS